MAHMPPFGNEAPTEHECQRCFRRWSTPYGTVSNPLVRFGPVIKGGKLALCGTQCIREMESDLNSEPPGWRRRDRLRTAWAQGVHWEW